MHTSNSFKAGHHIGMLVKPVISGFRGVLASCTHDKAHTEIDYSVYDSPAMVRCGRVTDLAAWQAENLKPSPELIPADFNAEIIPENWNRDPSPQSPSTLGQRSSLDALI